MRRMIAFCLFLLMLLSLQGCSLTDGDEVPAEFYYLRKPGTYLYGQTDGVVTFEQRDISGHEEDLRYLLTLYLQGPVSESLAPPFPAGCKLMDLQQTEEKITITLNANFVTLKGMDLTLACVCLAKTCLSVTEAESICIQAQGFSGSIAMSETIHTASLPEDIPSVSEPGT